MAHVAQLVEHVLGKDEVTRSIRVVGSSVDSEESCCVDPYAGGVELCPQSLERSTQSFFLNEGGGSDGEGEV